MHIFCIGWECRTSSIASSYSTNVFVFPIVGPPCVGRNELKRRLLSYDPDRFDEVVPC